MRTDTEEQAASFHSCEDSEFAVTGYNQSPYRGPSEDQVAGGSAVASCSSLAGCELDTRLENTVQIIGMRPVIWPDIMSLNATTKDDARKEDRRNYHVERRDDGQPMPLPPDLGIKHAVTEFSNHKLAAGGHGILFGSRIPLHFFTVHGFGETDQGDGNDPWETGSYDLALEDAGIQDFNVQSYTSVIPPESTPVTYEEAKPFFRHGAVMEVIMAVMHGVKGDRITAGVGRMQIRRKSDNQIIGGYAAEYKGHANKERAREILQLDLKNIFDRRFDVEHYEWFDEDYTVLEHEVEKGFGTILASICFVTYVEPVYTNVQL